MDTDPYRDMKAISRQHVDMIWKMAQRDEELSDEDTRLIEAMRDHPEYADLWGRLGELSDEQIERDGTNPIMHIIIHQTIENQIASGQPGETGQIIEALMRQGLSRHEAIHRVGTVLADEIWHILNDKRDFDAARFVRKLEQLKSGDTRPMTHFGKAWRPKRRAKGRYR